MEGVKDDGVTEAIISKYCSASLVMLVREELLEPDPPRWWRSQDVHERCCPIMEGRLVAVM